MGDLFNEIVIFLEEYYVYAISVGLIIILMLIGFLASKRKARKNHAADESMANINDVTTGSINDVANALQSDVMQPVDVVTFAEDTNVAENNDATSNTETVDVAPATVVESPTIEPVAPVVTPVSSITNDDAMTTSNATIEIPVAGENKVLEEITPVNEEKFDKTEIIDFSSLIPEISSETVHEDIKPFVVDNSQYADSNNILNGETSVDETPRV